MRRFPLSELEDRERGLTLIELLVAMTLLSMITTIVLGAIRFASQAWNEQGLADDSVADIATVRDWIRHALTEARPMTVNDEDDEPRLAFAGRDSEVAFVAPVPAHLGGSGVSWIEITTADTANGRQLVMSRRSFFPVDESDFQADERVLIEHIESVRFQYFGARAPDEPAAWHDSWLEMDYLPLLVSLSILPAGDDRMFWPSIVAAPMTDGTRPVNLRSMLNGFESPNG